MNKKELIQKYPEIIKEITEEYYRYYNTEINEESNFNQYKQLIFRQPILTTEDGKELFEGDVCFSYQDGQIINQIIYQTGYYPKEIKYFSNREVLIADLIENSRQLNYNDVFQIFEKHLRINNWNVYNDLFDEYKQLIKQRLGI